MKTKAHRTAGCDQAVLPFFLCFTAPLLCAKICLMICIIDYDAGNVKSVLKAFRYLGEEVILSRDRDVILKADHVVLPGVGNFGDAVDKIDLYGLRETIAEVVSRGTPFLGICVGLQLLFGGSEESPGAEGLHLLEGFNSRFKKEDGLKIPQIGWNSIHFAKESRLFKDVPDGSFVYFVHSYHASNTDDSDVSAVCTYGETFPAAVEKGNLFACQFHPEKSGKVGLKILRNFTEIGKGTCSARECP